MALLTAQPMNISGVAQTLTAANASDTVTPGDRTFLWVKTAGTATAVAIVTPSSLDRFGVTLGDAGSTTPATGDRLFGPLSPDLADPTTGLITITFTPTTAVTRAIVSM